MPLIKSSSKKAFNKNVQTEIKQGNKPIKQALAIAYATKREAENSKNKKSVKKSTRHNLSYKKTT